MKAKNFLRYLLSDWQIKGLLLFGIVWIAFCVNAILKDEDNTLAWVFFGLYFLIDFVVVAHKWTTYKPSEHS